MYSKLRTRYKKLGTTVEEDAIYGSKLFSLYINRIMKSGKKNLARKIWYKTIAALAGEQQEGDRSDRQQRRNIRQPIIGTGQTEENGARGRAQGQAQAQGQTQGQTQTQTRRTSRSASETVISIVETATKKAAPHVEFKTSRARFGKKSKPVPVEMRSYRSSKIAIKWIVAGARQVPRTGKYPFWRNLSKALLAASTGKGYAISTKKTLHKRARKSLNRPPKKSISSTPNNPSGRRHPHHKRPPNRNRPDEPKFERNEKHL